MKRLGVALTLAGLLTGIPLLGHSQTRDRSFEITPFGGYTIYDKDVIFLEAGPNFGGRLAWFPIRNVGVEGTIGFGPGNSLDREELAAAGADTTAFGDPEIDVAEIRIDGIYQLSFNPEQKIVPYLAAGVGQLVFDQDVSDPEEDVEDLNEPQFAFNAGGGIKIFFGESIALRLDARNVIAQVERGFARNDLPPGNNTKTFFADNLELTGGLTFTLGGTAEEETRDSDRDGVADGDDLCPNTPPGVIVDETGCPVDSDGDGVPDGLDACPNTPRGASVDERGCPTDSDNDGVPDGTDQCPNTPAGTQVDEKGCPVEKEITRTDCLSEQAWYTNNEAISVDGKNWLQFGDVQTASMQDVEQIGDYQGVPVYAKKGARRPYRELWLPLCEAEGRYQPFRLESEVRGTTGTLRVK